MKRCCVRYFSLGRPLSVAAIFLVTVASSLGASGPVGYSPIAPKFANWTLKSHEAEITAILARRIKTIDDLDLYYQMALLVGSQGTPVPPASGKVLDAMVGRVKDTPRQLQALGLKGMEEQDFNECGLRFLDSALRGLLKVDPSRFCKLPFELSQDQEIVKGWQGHYVECYLNALWSSGDTSVGMKACANLQAHLRPWINKKQQQRCQDVLFRFDLRDASSQEKAWGLLFDRFRPDSLHSALLPERRAQSNRWIGCLKETYKRLDSSIPLEIVKSQEEISVAEAYVLLDWSCRAWNMSYQELKDKEDFKTLGESIKVAIEKFYATNGQSIKAQAASDGRRGKCMDYLRDTFGAILKSNPR